MAAIDARIAIENLSGLTPEQKSEAIAGFQGTADYTSAAYNEVLNNHQAWGGGTQSFSTQPNFEWEARPNFIFGGKGRKFWRAVLRVVVAVAVTAVLTAFPIAVIVAAKVIAKAGIAKAIVSGGQVAWIALKKGIVLSNWKVSSMLLSGLTAGVKNAEKSWDKSWQGSVEFQFAIKVAPVYY